MTRALIFVPPDAPDEASFTDHVRRRGYHLAGRIGDWASIAQALADRIVSVVVVARKVYYSRAHSDPGAMTERITPQAAPAAAGKHRRPLSSDRIGAGLMAATVGVGVAWAALELGTDARWASWVLVSMTVASWVPYAGWILDRAWREDIARAELHGRAEGARDGYTTGFVDCLIVRST